MVGVNEQRLQNHPLMTDKVRGWMSLSIWVKRQPLATKDLRHWRALSSFWPRPNNSKPDYTVGHVGDDEAAALG